MLAAPLLLNGRVRLVRLDRQSAVRPAAGDFEFGQDGFCREGIEEGEKEPKESGAGALTPGTVHHKTKPCRPLLIPARTLGLSNGPSASHKTYFWKINFHFTSLYLYAEKLEPYREGTPYGRRKK